MTEGLSELDRLVSLYCRICREKESYLRNNIEWIWNEKYYRDKCTSCTLEKDTWKIKKELLRNVEFDVRIVFNQLDKKNYVICPACDKILGIFEEKIKFEYSYCPFCGHKVKL